MRVKRIIPCLDVKDGRVVKGVNFVDFKDAGDPVACAVEYERQGADELIFLDIAATVEGRSTMKELVKETARAISIPLTVGGGIRGVDDVWELLDAGAAKASVSTAAVKCPELLVKFRKHVGSDRIVLAVDGKLDGKDPAKWTANLSAPRSEEYPDTFSVAEAGLESVPGAGMYHVIVKGGQVDTGVDLISWVRQASRIGVGEILLTSVDADGTKSGFDIPMLKAVCDIVDVPVIASGGGGSLESFVEVFTETGVDAALGASVFHFGELTVGDVKAALHERGIPVR